MNEIPTANAGNDQTIPYNTSATLSATDVGAGATYQWLPANMIQGNPNQQTVHTVQLTADQTYTLMLGGCIAAALVGLFFLIKPDVVVSAFNYIFGSIMIMAGLVVLITSLGNSRRVGKGWWVTALFGLAAAILGAIVLFAEVGDNVISILAGIALILCGVAGIVETIRLRQAFDRMSKREFTPPPGDRVGPA